MQTPKFGEQKTHPYADVLEKTLTTQRKMETLLQNKISHLTTIIETQSKTDSFLTYTVQEKLALVDYEIQLIRVNGELEILKKVIREKENYFKQYMEQFEIDIKEVELRFKNTIAIAKKSTKPNVVKLLSELNWEDVDNDDEVKIKVYKQLKKHV